MAEWIETTPVPSGLIHPAIKQLLRAQAASKWRKLRRAFSSRRRVILSIVATLLAMVWIGNVALSVIFRQATPPERFAKLVPIGFFVYALWHVVKTSFARPEQDIEWTPSEAEFVCGAPLHRHQLIVYRMAGILNATLLKASCFAVLMLPDLPRPFAGFLGFFMGLVFVDLIRMAIEITCHSMATPNYRRLRLATGVLVVGAVVSTVVIAFSQPNGWFTGSSQMTLAIVKHLLASSGQLLETPVGKIALVPFGLFGRVAVTREIDSAWFMQALAAFALVGGASAFIVRLDAYYSRARASRERSEYPPREATVPGGEAKPANRATQRIARMPWLGGAGPIAWRQWIGAKKHSGSLVVAMALPGLLALLPVWVCSDGAQAALQVSGAVTFYSFLLLPTALKFDFRRDITRMIVLKALPVRPIAVVFGQILTPACLAFAFQTTVLLITMLFRPFPISTLLFTLLLFFPLNLLIFAIDNLVYLLYPYRLNQEGIEIFLRTTLTFTAKGILFTLGLVGTFFWSFAANRISQQLSHIANPALIFVIGSWLMLCLATYLTTVLLSKAYGRFDPSQDMPL